MPGSVTITVARLAGRARSRGRAAAATRGSGNRCRGRCGAETARSPRSATAAREAASTSPPVAPGVAAAKAAVGRRAAPPRTPRAAGRWPCRRRPCACGRTSSRRRTVPSSSMTTSSRSIRRVAVSGSTASPHAQVRARTRPSRRRAPRARPGSRGRRRRSRPRTAAAISASVRPAAARSLNASSPSIAISFVHAQPVEVVLGLHRAAIVSSARVTSTSRSVPKASRDAAPASAPRRRSARRRDAPARCLEAALVADRAAARPRARRASSRRCRSIAAPGAGRRVRIAGKVRMSPSKPAARLGLLVARARAASAAPSRGTTDDPEAADLHPVAGREQDVLGEPQHDASTPASRGACWSCSIRAHACDRLRVPRLHARDDVLDLRQHRALERRGVRNRRVLRGHAHRRARQRVEAPRRTTRATTSLAKLPARAPR